jgi:hypothetical protein
MNESFVLIALSLLGMLTHSLMKMGSLKKDYEVANKAFDWRRDYLYRDYIGISISLISSVAWFFLFGEAAAKFTALEGFTRTSFFIMGGMGSYVTQLAFGASKKYIRKVVDYKTNKADGIS